MSSDKTISDLEESIISLTSPVDLPEKAGKVMSYVESVGPLFAVMSVAIPIFALLVLCIIYRREKS